MGAAVMGMASMGGMNMTTPMTPPPSSMSMPMPMPMKKKMMMHMTFFWGHRVEILFSGWPGDRGLAVYLLALFIVFLASLLLECLSSAPFLRLLGPTPASSRARRSFAGGLLLTAIGAVRTGLSYMVMLAVMSFNGGVLIAAILGHAVGFFVFGSGVVFGGGGEAHPDQALINGHGSKC